MTPTIPTTEPTECVAGDTIKWDKTISDYPPSDGWTLSYMFRGPVDFDLGTSEITNASSYYQVRVPAAKTQGCATGQYKWFAVVSNGGGDRYTVGQGTIRIKPNPADAVNAKSQAEQILFVINAALKGRLTADIESYQIEGRAVNKIPIEQLEKLRGKYAARVRRERGGGTRMTQSVEVTFVRPV